LAPILSRREPLFAFFDVFRSHTDPEHPDHAQARARRQNTALDRFGSSNNFHAPKMTTPLPSPGAAAASDAPQAKRPKTDAGAAACGSAAAAPAAPSAAGVQPVLPANECINFHLLKLVDGAAALEEGAAFPPEMTHQLFGVAEEVRGHEGLDVSIYFTPRFLPLIEVAAAGRAPGATDLKAPLDAAFQPLGFFTDKAAFDAALAAEAPLTLAELGEPVVAAAAPGGGALAVHHATLASAPPALRELHARLAPLLYFFVDGASAIDAAEPGWELLTVAEAAPGGAVRVLGFATLFSFWAFPDRRRLRLSQILVLPPYQGRGAGGLLLSAAYALAARLDAVDVPFEEPSEELARLRDRADVRRATEAAWPAEAAAARLAAAADTKGKAPAAAAGAAPLAPPPEVLARLRAELRLARGQAKRVWDALLFAAAAAAGGGAALAAAEGHVRAGVRASVAAARAGAAGKSIRATEGEGFVMCRGAAAAGGAPVRGAVVPVEGATAEQHAAEVEGAVAARVRELRRAAGLPVEEGEEESGEGEAE
jgi:histone acetyltransferase 1